MDAVLPAYLKNQQDYRRLLDAMHDKYFEADVQLMTKLLQGELAGQDQTPEEGAEAERRELEAWFRRDEASPPPSAPDESGDDGS